MKVGPTSSALDGARTSLYCATSLEAPSHGGRFFVPFGKMDHRPDKWLDDSEAVRKLWDLANQQLRSSGFILEL